MERFDSVPRSQTGNLHSVKNRSSTIGRNRFMGRSMNKSMIALLLRLARKYARRALSMRILCMTRLRGDLPQASWSLSIRLPSIGLANVRIMWKRRPTDRSSWSLVKERNVSQISVIPYHNPFTYISRSPIYLSDSHG